MIESILKFKKTKKWNDKYIISYDDYFDISLKIKLTCLVLFFVVSATISYSFNNYFYLTGLLAFYFIGIYIHKLMQSLGASFMSNNEHDCLFWFILPISNRLYLFFSNNTIKNVEEKQTKAGVEAIVTRSTQSLYD